ncbi:MAG: carboxymuconolactone decarboxylase family protein [Blastocatellia bacterium]
MTRLNALSPENATGKTKELFTAIKGKLGMVPNMMRTMGNSSELLDGYLSFSGALGGGILGGKIGELIALAVAESNDCDYCLSAHTYIGENLVNLDSETLSSARGGNSSEAKTDAILKFAKILVAKKGLVSDADVDSVKNAGVTEGEIGEIVGHVALNIFTNYFNNTANTEIDFPAVKAFTA